MADRFADALVAVCEGQPATSPQATLCQRVARYRTDLFIFVADPAVPPTNNAAERALRPLVIARKVSGGTRSKRGSQSRMILQSLVATWDLRGLDPVAEFLALLTSPPQHCPGIAPLRTLTRTDADRGKCASAQLVGVSLCLRQSVGPVEGVW